MSPGQALERILSDTVLRNGALNGGGDEFRAVSPNSLTSFPLPLWDGTDRKKALVRCQPWPFSFQDGKKGFVSRESHVVHTVVP